MVSFVKQEIKKMLKVLEYKSYKNKAKSNHQKEIILFATPLHGNLGDHAIAIAEYKLLQDNQLIPFEVATGEKDNCYNYLLRHIDEDAIICITGGGFIGSQWLNEENFVRQIIHDYSEHTIIIFPQTLYYKDDENGRKEYEISRNIYKQAKKLNVFVREEKSYKIAKEMLPETNIQLVPDIVLYLKQQEYQMKQDKVLLCIRHDVESKLKEEERKTIEKIAEKYGTIENTDTVINRGVKAKKRQEEVNKKLKEFAESKLIITDRLHGMIFAMLTRTPCITLGNYNHKVKGVYQWFNNCNYVKYLDNIDNLETIIDEIMKIKPEDYTTINLQSKYKKLEEILEKEGKKNG